VVAIRPCPDGRALGPPFPIAKGRPGLGWL
jgi:hypothetical protein